MYPYANVVDSIHSIAWRVFVDYLISKCTISRVLWGCGSSSRIHLDGVVETVSVYQHEHLICVRLFTAYGGSIFVITYCHLGDR